VVNRSQVSEGELGEEKGRENFLRPRLLKKDLRESRLLQQSLHCHRQKKDGGKPKKEETGGKHKSSTILRQSIPLRKNGQPPYCQKKTGKRRTWNGRVRKWGLFMKKSKRGQWEFWTKPREANPTKNGGRREAGRRSDMVCR